MVFGLFRKKNSNERIVEQQYAKLTSTARTPVFYLDMNVPDTVMGRFEMLSLVMILYFRRTRFSDARGKEIAQAIVDAFFQDIDHSIRELGVGDSSVPKRMKKLAKMFYGRLESYAQAMDGADAVALEAALRRNIHPTDLASHEMTALAAWALEVDGVLRTVREDDIVAGTIELPVRH
ncbi:ubiquinol-cytochrome C chaperone family protein [Oryzifoliimicrobium ureilyticus]|uniref:ubiquinol-cytochrome C chaperone family protein n=1 Tax=Oryzifoliimicrobium ureilyticus TaxID=3113724 RepID=UPI0030761EBE